MRWMRHAIRCAVLAGVVCAVVCGQARAEPDRQQPAPRRLPIDLKDIPAHEEQWLSLWMGRRHSGWSHVVLERVAAAASRTGRETIHVRREGHWSVRYGEQPHSVVVVEDAEFDSTAPFALLRLNSSETHDVATSSITLTRTDAGMDRVTTTPFGDVRVDSIPALDYTLSDELAPRLWIAAGRKSGDSMQRRILCKGSTRVGLGVQTLTVLDVEVPPAGVSAPRWIQWMESTEGTSEPETLWYSTPEGKILWWRQERSTATAASEQEARDLSTGPADIFDVLGWARVDGVVGDITGATSLSLSVSGKGAERIPCAPRQSVRVDPITRRVAVRLGDGSDTFPRPTAAEIREATSLTPRYGEGTAEVARLAEEAVAGNGTAAERTRHILDWVRGFLASDRVSGDLPIEQIVSARIGDCSEHALLFVALARSVGIPAREVFGLVYTGGPTPGFAPHRWAEVVIDERWVAVDPTYGQMPIDIAHVALNRGEGCLEPAGMDIESFTVRPEAPR